MGTQRVPRIEDLPYATSPPVQFVYQSIATLAAGQYVWNDEPGSMVEVRPLLTSALYYFRSVSFSADISVLDYTTNLSTIPRFRLHAAGDSDTMMYREPLLAVSFLEDFQYRFCYFPYREDDEIKGSFRGILTQGPGLIGKTSITLTAIISAQEIIDTDFVDAVKRKYPSLRGDS